VVSISVSVKPGMISIRCPLSVLRWEALATATPKLNRTGGSAKT